MNASLVDDLAAALATARHMLGKLATDAQREEWQELVNRALINRGPRRARAPSKRRIA